MTLGPDQMMLHYRLIEKIGEGGMGVVWRAVDTTLDREVAIKVLPEAFSTDAGRLTRFEREAKVLASMNHPNIASIHGLHEAGNMRFLAMELVTGADLSQRLAHGPLPLDECLGIAGQIAEALEAAHANGVVHRDLKPANVMLTEDDKIKVLDFGLAKLAIDVEPVSGTDASRSPTVTSAGTRAGMILGTAAYMSPEQARGKPVDRRADIWALGCLLFEMLTGRGPFTGETVTDVLAAVVRADPDWETLPTETPARVRHLLRRCLMKDPHHRLHDIADARIELEEPDGWFGDEPTLGTERVEKATPRPRELGAWLLVVVATVFSAWVYFGSSENVRPSVDPVRFSINPPGFVNGLAEESMGGDRYDGVAVSPDGSQLAFIANDENGTFLIWVRPFTHPDATPLEGTDGAEQLFWSPDGDRIAFRTRGELFVVPTTGGHVQRLAANVPESSNGGSWSRQGVILLGAVNGVWRVDEGGGALTRLSELDEFGFWPSFLPDGEHFLYLSEIEKGKGSGADNLGIHVASLADPLERRLLLSISSRSIYSDRYILYIIDGALTAQPFDIEKLALSGDALVLADHLDYFKSHGGSTFSAAAGRLIYVTTKPLSLHRWMDRKGEDRGSLGEPASYARLTSISPDGTRAVGAVRSPRIGTMDLVLFDLERGVSSRITTAETWESYPAWSPDGRHIAYASDPTGPPDIFVLDLAGGAAEKLLLARPGVQQSLAWAPVGGEILFSNGLDEMRLWSLSATGEGDPARLAPSAPVTLEACFSPDGRWLAFSSLESGRHEIYVQPFRRPGAKIRLSRNGGRRPRWRRDGEEIFFQAGRSVVAVPVEPGDDFVSGTPVTLFTLEEPFSFQDAMPDGQRFLIVTKSSQSDSQPIHVMLDWQEYLPDPSRRVD